MTRSWPSYFFFPTSVTPETIVPVEWGTGRRGKGKRKEEMGKKKAMKSGGRGKNPFLSGEGTAVLTRTLS